MVKHKSTMSTELSTARMALTRELEHAIDDCCESIIKKVNHIMNNTYVDAHNFESMTYVLEALEDIRDTTSLAVDTITAASILNKLNYAQKKISIVDE